MRTTTSSDSAPTRSHAASPTRRRRRASALTIFALAASLLLTITASKAAPSAAQSEPVWAFEETFDGDPSSPSQALLPDEFDYVVTHRTHPKEHFTKAFAPYPADHDDSCAGPNPDVSPLPQHMVQTTQTSNGANPDPSFFVCKNHMMSSMGEVEFYSVSAFWPRQEFNFADGGVLEFDVNINEGHENRSWWELMITPRDQLKVGAGPLDSAIDETYPNDRIVLDFRRNVRTIKVGTGALAPDGWLVNERQFAQYDWAYWSSLHPDDPATADRRIRRTMRIRMDGDRVIWGIETEDGSFDEMEVTVPGGLPFDQGLVVFKTHAYTPHKNNNYDTYTFHWDNIRFDGPVVGRYDAAYADDAVYLQRNGDRQIGESETVTISLDAVGPNPALFGQLHQPMRGQVLLSVNGRPNIEVAPYEYDRDDCLSTDWKSFRLDLDPSWLQPGDNTFTWTIGPRPACAQGQFVWDGFSVKALQLQTDAGSTPAPDPTPDPTPQPTPSPEPEPTPEPTPTPPDPTPEPTPTPTPDPDPTVVELPTVADGAALIDPPTTLAEGGPLDSADTTWIWLEQGPLVLEKDLTVNRHAPGQFNGNTQATSTIAAGTTVCSFRVHADALADRGRLTGSATFAEATVLGIIHRTRQLRASTFLAAPATRERVGGAERGDRLSFTNDGAATIAWDFSFGRHLDQLRIITSC